MKRELTMFSIRSSPRREEADDLATPRLSTSSPRWLRLSEARLLHLTVLLVLLALVPGPGHAASRIGSTPYRVSVTGAGNSHSPVFSADGKHVAFVSHANNLVTNDDLGPHLDLFIRNLVTSNTVLVSVSTNGFGGANDNIGLYSLSSNAQVVAFDTVANNFVAWDNNRVSDVYARNLEFGGMTRVSTGIDGDANGSSYNPLISEDGRYVIFESLASNLVTNDFNGTNDIFIHDLTTGVTELVSVNADGTASPDGPSHSPSISADGLTVAFVSHATNLVESLIHPRPEVYGRDLVRRMNLRAAADININSVSGTYSSTFPYSPNSLILSRSGRYASFQTPGQFIRYDLHSPTNFVTSYSNATPPAVALVYYSFADNPRLVSGAKGTSSGGFAIEGDGRFMFHETTGNWLGQRGLVRTDLETLESITFEIDPWGCCGLVTKTISLMELVLSNSTSFPQTWSNLNLRKITGDGSRVYYVRDSVSATNGSILPAHFYVLDTSNRIERVLLSPRDAGRELGMGGVIPVVSEDGKHIAWDSADDSLVSNDLNRAWDVFVRNVDTGETQLVSARHPDLPAASGIAMSRLDLNSGAISANGQRFAILSLDSTLAPDDTNHWRDLFIRDLATGTNIDVSRSKGRVFFSAQTNFPGSNTAAAPFLSADGRHVAFAAEASTLGQAALIATNTILYWRDLSASSNHVVASGSSLSQLILSSDARLMAFHSPGNHDFFNPDGNNHPDVFLLGPRRIASDPPPDCQISTLGFPPDFVSTAWGGNQTANGPSVHPALTPDDRCILFQSLARNLLEDTLPPQTSYQLYARSFEITNGATFDCRVRAEMIAYQPTRLISYGTAASLLSWGTSVEVPLPGGGANPRFSADSRYVAFESSTNLIYRHDLSREWIVTVTQQGGTLYTNRARLTNDLVCTGCGNPALSADGRFVAFETRPAPGGPTDVLLKNLETGQGELVSVNQVGGAGGNGSSFAPLISYDARFVVFASKASDLVPGDNNRATDIFLRDRVNGTTHCLSRNWSGTGTGNRVSSNPIMSADGRTVAFQSFASDLVPGDYNDTRDVFVVTLAGPDADNDELDDDWEVAYFSNLNRDGSGDFDADGASDLAEFRAGTSPANGSSILRVISIASAVSAPPPLNYQRTIVLWASSPGRTYRVQFKENVDALWTDLPGEVTASGTSASATHSVFTTTPRGFYRVLLAQ